MDNKRKYNRLKLNNLEVHGKMVMASEVEVIDISISGISLKTDRRLNIGSAYTIKLEGKNTISLKGTVVWCSLIETRKVSEGEMINIYSAGVQFKDMTTERISELQCLIESHKIKELHVTGGTRLNMRFHIKDPENTILICPDNYKVNIISLGGMSIECRQNFEIESRIPMDMFVYDDSSIKFVGRVTSSQAVIIEGQEQYNIGIEFLDLTEKDREALASFIENSTEN